MEKYFFRITSFLEHLVTSHDLHGLHSPFLYDWYEQCVDADKEYVDFEQLGKIKTECLSSRGSLLFNELGAKLHKGSKSVRISELAAKSGSLESVRKCLYKTIDRFQPKKLIEIGSSIGLTSIYLSKAMPVDGELVLMDGNSSVLDHAAHLCQKVAPHKKIKSVLGLFDHTLPTVLKEIGHVDFVYFDGNHTREATLRYFHWVMDHVSENAILVFDDIYWSKGMLEAWKEICTHPRLVFTVDMYHSGFCFLGLNTPKQHFKLRYKNLGWF